MMSNTNRTKLTKKVVENQKATNEKRLLLWDTEITGFCVRIYPSERKTYFFQYRNESRQTKFLKIGVHGVFTTEQAREKAKHIALEVSTGMDPAKVKDQKKSNPTMETLAHDYLVRHASNKRSKSSAEDRLMINNIVIPAYGNTLVKEITNREVGALHLKLKHKPYRANRLLSLLSKMFSLAIIWGWRNDNPAKNIKKYQEHKRTRWLSQEEMERLWMVLDAYQDQNVANVYRLLLLTGSRRGEALNATWDQFDLVKGVWTKPAHNTKQKRMEHIPLSSHALELLKAMKMKSKGGDYLFPGKVEGQPLKEIKKSWATIKKQTGIEDVRIHDLRHTYASHLVSSGLSLSIVGKLLGHTQASTTQRYAHLADEPLRQATEIFGKKLGKANSG